VRAFSPSLRGGKADEAIQRSGEGLDCFGAVAPRNDEEKNAMSNSFVE